MQLMAHAVLKFSYPDYPGYPDYPDYRYALAVHSVSKLNNCFTLISNYCSIIYCLIKQKRVLRHVNTTCNNLNKLVFFGSHTNNFFHVIFLKNTVD